MEWVTLFCRDGINTVISFVIHVVVFLFCLVKNILLVNRNNRARRIVYKHELVHFWNYFGKFFEKLQ